MVFLLQKIPIGGEEGEQIAVIAPNALPFCTIEDTVQRFTLNIKLAVKIVLEHFTKTQAGENPPQLLMSILGEPGVSKSVVASAISWHLTQHNASDHIIITAFTGMFYFTSLYNVCN